MPADRPLRRVLAPIAGCARACGRAALVLVLAGTASAAAQMDWPSYNRDPSSDRFVPLTEITPVNAAQLREVCEVDLGDPGLSRRVPWSSATRCS